MERQLSSKVQVESLRYEPTLQNIYFIVFYGVYQVVLRGLRAPPNGPQKLDQESSARVQRYQTVLPVVLGITLVVQGKHLNFYYYFSGLKLEK